jgi:hypothetical protein
MTARDGLVQDSGNNSVQTTPFVFHDGVGGWRGLPHQQAQGTSTVAIPSKKMADFEAADHSYQTEIRKTFIFPSDSSVITFLNEHRTLPEILLEAAQHLRTSFGADAIFNLRTPIDESGERTLYAVVMWPGTVEAVRAALASFDDIWWLANSRRTSGHLTFTYELV